MLVSAVDVEAALWGTQVSQSIIVPGDMLKDPKMCWLYTTG